MKMSATLIAASVAGLAGFGWTLASYKPPPETPFRAASDASFGSSPNRWTSRDPAERIRQLTAALEQNPLDADAWRRLGWNQMWTGDDTSAKASWATAAEVQRAAAPPQPDMKYLFDLACCLALTGDREGALTAWNGCVDAGWDDPDRAERSRDLNSIRDDPRFIEGFQRIVPRPGGVRLLDAG